LAQSDGHDSPGLIDEIVPSLAAVVDAHAMRVAFEQRLLENDQ
jgi:hypothetical protein